MSRTVKNHERVLELFKPNEVGFSHWISRDAIDMSPLQLGDNGNIRQGTPWTDHYIWEIKRMNNKERGKPIAFRTVGFMQDKIKKRPIRTDIRKELLEKTPRCLHCGTDKTLVIDHKNDMYNDDRVLDKDAQSSSDFQVLCDKCNNDLKHNAHEKEKRTGKLHLAKYLQLPALAFDDVYPWEVAVKNYNATDIHCKMYTYWFDVEEFWRRRNIYIHITKHINAQIKSKLHK